MHKDGIVAVGAETVRASSSINTNLCLQGIWSLHPEAGITHPNLAEAQVKRAMIESADRLVASASADELGTASSFVVAPASAVIHLVTEESVPEADLAPFRELGVEVTKGRRQWRRSRVRPREGALTLAGGSPGRYPWRVVSIYTRGNGYPRTGSVRQRCLGRSRLAAALIELKQRGTPVDEQHRPGDRAGGLGAEERGGFGNLLRRLPFAQRYHPFRPPGEIRLS